MASAKAKIRVARDSDADGLAAIYGPIVEATAISFETVVPDAQEMARRVNETLRSHPWLVCDAGGQVIGYAYATKHRVRAAYQWSVDTSVYTDGKYRRRGVGQGLYRSLFAVLAAQGFYNAYAGIALPNPGSVGLHESVGFRKIGEYRRVGYKLGAWHDVGWWQLTLREHEDAPQAPLDFASACELPDWRVLLARGESAIQLQSA